MSTQSQVYTFRANGNMYRVRKAPTEMDDDAADRGWWIAKHASSTAVAPALSTVSFQYIQNKNLKTVYENAAL